MISTYVGTFFIFLGVYIAANQLMFGIFGNDIMIGGICIFVGAIILNIPVEILVVIVLFVFSKWPNSK